MIIITTRSYPPELGGMQSLMGGLAIHLNDLHPIKVLANSFVGDESYDKRNDFETNRMGEAASLPGKSQTSSSSINISISPKSSSKAPRQTFNDVS